LFEAVSDGAPGGHRTRTARELALRALRHRDHSALELEQRLARRGIAKPVRDEVLATLTRTGLVDDRRFSETLAGSLAARGAGDLLIADRLRRAGIAPELAGVLERLDPEVGRARTILARRGPGSKTARYLFGKGFSEETIATVANVKDEELG
jgi:SOS response regulatory protein OraA/RecX